MIKGYEYPISVVMMAINILFKNVMNILFCGDENVRDGIFLSVLSILKNTKQILNVYIFTMSYDCVAIGEDFAKSLEREAKKWNAKNSVRLFDISEMVKKDAPEKNIKTVFTPCCLLRLYADNLPEIPDKILYLDADVMAYRNFDEFYDMDISDYELAGVLDNYGAHFFHKESFFKKDYLNSGVLLLNMKKIRETGLFARCRELCKSKKMFMPDQSAINKLVTARKIVPRKFNEQKNMRGDTVLRHFTTTVHFLPYFRVQKIKQWDTEKLHSTLKTFEFDDIIEYYECEVK